MATKDDVIEGLREVYDPELHYNIWDLGLVYDIDVQDGDVKLVMTLTTPACPIGPMVTEQIEETIGLLPGIRNVDIEWTFDPPWSPERMSDEARADLGLD
jgi:metal-sulfur cluster biosynthetic enzyme